MNVDTIDTPRIEPQVQNAERDCFQAFLVTAIFIALFAVWLGFEAPRGTMWGTDELLTAERSREILMTGPWVVNYNFHQSFEKPPLQYWLTSLTLARFQNRAVAVRIWPLLYGILSAATLAWLVRVIAPDQPWLIPLAVGILLSAPLFVPECVRGLLDIGLAFFTTLTILFAELGRKNPWYWFGCAIACWLGSLQKMPVPFLVWVLVVIVRLTNREDRAVIRSGSRYLIGGMLLAVALMSIWPLLQLIKYEMPVWRVFDQEVIVWLGPDFLGRRPYFEIPISMILNPGGLCGFLSLIALFVVLFSRKNPPSRSVRELALVSLAFLALAIVFNFRHVRYAIPIVPCLCLLLGFVAYQFLMQQPPVRTRAVLGLLVLLMAGFVHSKIVIDSRRRNVADEKLIAEKLAALQNRESKIVLIRAIVPGNDLMWDSFYLFHGNLRFPVNDFTVDQIRENPPKPPIIGACIARDFPVVKGLYPNVKIALTSAQFICWQVPQS
jgi:4-amino-4-deoxy-L-arabinose transferase-like glycosyltransferase